MDVIKIPLRRYLDEDQERSHPIHPTSTQDDSSTSGDHNNSSSTNMTTTTTTTTTNMVVVGILVGLICILTCVLILLLIRPVMDFLHARLPENKRRKELRYRTVEGWVISKVCIDVGLYDKCILHLSTWPTISSDTIASLTTYFRWLFSTGTFLFEKVFSILSHGEHWNTGGTHTTHTLVSPWTTF